MFKFKITIKKIDMLIEYIGIYKSSTDAWFAAVEIAKLPCKIKVEPI